MPSRADRLRPAAMLCRMRVLSHARRSRPCSRRLPLRRRRAPTRHAVIAALTRQADAWDKAIVRKDRAAVAANMADDFRSIDGAGTVETKPVFVDGLMDAKLTIDPYTVEDFDVRLFGDVALLSGRTRMTGRFDGKPFTSHYRYIDIYAKRNGALADRQRADHAPAGPVIRRRDQPARTQRHISANVALLPCIRMPTRKTRPPAQTKNTRRRPASARSPARFARAPAPASAPSAAS